MFLMPLSLGVLLMIIALIFLYLHQIRKAKWILTSSIVWFFLFSYPPFANVLLQRIESNYPTLHNAPKDIKYIYVLGGGHHTDDSLPITSQIVDTSVVRLNEGLRLYHQLNEKASIIVSG